MLNEPYKAVIEMSHLGVRLVISAEAENDTEEARKEADRRALVIANHFRIISQRA